MTVPTPFKIIRSSEKTTSKRRCVMFIQWLLLLFFAWSCEISVLHASNVLNYIHQNFIQFEKHAKYHLFHFFLLLMLFLSLGEKSINRDNYVFCFFSLTKTYMSFVFLLVSHIISYSYISFKSRTFFKANITVSN